VGKRGVNWQLAQRWSIMQLSIQPGLPSINQEREPCRAWYCLCWERFKRRWMVVRLRALSRTKFALSSRTWQSKAIVLIHAKRLPVCSGPISPIEPRSAIFAMHLPISAKHRRPPRRSTLLLVTRDTIQFNAQSDYSSMSQPCPSKRQSNLQSFTPLRTASLISHRPSLLSRPFPRRILLR